MLVTGYAFVSNGALGYFAYATIAYSGGGVPLWTNYYTGPASDQNMPQTKSSLTVGPEGAVYVTGISDGNLAIGYVTFDFATVKYAPAAAPTIVVQPASRTNLTGTTATFSVGATGPGSLSYQWRRNGTNFFDGGNISGTGTPTLTITNIAPGNAADYAVVVTNTYGSVTSVVVTLTAVLRPSLVSAPRLDGSDFIAHYSGTPGITYTIEFTPELSPPNWQKATNLMAPATDLGLGIGVFEFRQDTTTTMQRFYRVVYPAY